MLLTLGTDATFIEVTEDNEVIFPGAETRFYFDNEWKVCRKFIFKGHGGNLNNFLTEQECKEICGQDFKGMQVITKMCQ